MALDRIHISIAADPANLKQIRLTSGKMAASSGLSEEDAHMVVLAVDEALSNAIKHCCKDSPDRFIDVTFSLENHTLAVIIVDNGDCFDISSIRPRDMEEIRPGGLGVHIIREVMDIVEYSHTPDGFNQVRLVKNLKPDFKDPSL